MRTGDLSERVGPGFTLLGSARETASYNRGALVFEVASASAPLGPFLASHRGLLPISARSLRDVYDDDNTLVMPTRPTPHATSAVIPIARGRDGRSGATIHPIDFDVAAVRGDAPVAIPRSRAAQTTQPSRRHTSDVKRYRRLSIALALCLAFVLGVTASLAAQIAAHFTPAAPRTPRDGITRGESMQIFDGVETKAAPSPRPRRTVSRPPALSPPPTTPPAAATSDSISDSTATPSAPSDLAGRDLLREGLSDD